MGARAHNDNQRIRISFLLDLNEYPELAFLRDIAGHGARPRRLLQLATRGVIFERELKRRMQGTLGLNDEVAAMLVDAMAQEQLGSGSAPAKARPLAFTQTPEYPVSTPVLRPAHRTHAPAPVAEPAKSTKSPVSTPITNAPATAAVPTLAPKKVGEAKKIAHGFLA